MRNLKRALSLTLASVMLLGMMVVGSSAAAGYDDVSETDNVEAIEVLQAIEVMVGDERGFGPERPVNRAEMAVVMGKLLSLDYNYYSTSCPFNDVYDWAQGWVGACAANGIVSGRGEGVYDPGATVTAVEAASMLMRALGYFKYSNDYADGFEVSTVRQGTIIGIFDNVGSSATEPMTRNQVAQMVLNALQSAVVEPDGNTINLTTPDGTVLTGKVNYVSVTSNKPFARAISTVQATSIGSTNDSTIVELGERLYNGDLRLTAYDTDDFERPARTWEYDGKEIGTYVKKELLRESYTEKITGRMLYDLLTKNTIDTYDFVIAIDGETEQTYLDAYGYFTEGNLVRTNTEKIGNTGKGVLTEVYVDTKAEIVYIAVINTYLAKAVADYNEKKEEATFEVWSLANAGSPTNKHLVKSLPTTLAPAKVTMNLTVKDEDFNVADTKKDDIVLFNVAKGEVQKIVDPEVVDDTTISSFKNGSWVNAGGTQYDYASTAQYDEEVLDRYGDTNMKDTNYRVFLDRYGYMIGLEIIEAPSQYAFLTGIDGDKSNIDNKSAKGNLIFTDGTVKTVTINLEKSKALDDTHVANSGTDPYKAFTPAALWNTWCTYSVDSDGVYTLTEVADNDAHFGDDDNGVNYTGTRTDKVGQGRNSTAANRGPALTPDGKNIITTIDKKQISLNSAITSYTKVYGNDNSIYLLAETKHINNASYLKPPTAGTPNPGTEAVVISGVDAVTTGVQNASLDAFSYAGTATLNNGKNTFTTNTTNAEANTSEGVYTLFKDDGFVIAAVVVGEDNGVSSTYAYVTGNVKQEDWRDSEGNWKWYRDVIINGEETTLEEVSDSRATELNKMSLNNWYEVKFKADGTVKSVQMISTNDTVAGANHGEYVFCKDPETQYHPAYVDGVNVGDYPKFVGLIELVEQAQLDNSGKVVLFEDMTAANGASYKLSTKGNSLQVQTSATTSKGFSVSANAKIVLVQDKEIVTSTGAHISTSPMDIITTNYSDGGPGLEQAVKYLNDNDADGIFDGYISAVFENGFATSVIIYEVDPNKVDQGSSNARNNILVTIANGVVDVDFTNNGSNPSGMSPDGDPWTVEEQVAAIESALLKAGYTDPDIQVSGGAISSVKAKRGTTTYNFSLAGDILPYTADVTLTLTTPTADPTNTIAVAGTGATRTVTVNVDNATNSVVITGAKTAAQTVAITGTNAADVTPGGTDTAPTYTVDTTGVSAAGGDKVFTLTVSETGAQDVVYNVTVTVAEAPAVPTLTMTQAPTKTTYKVGETVDWTGAKVTFDPADGTAPVVYTAADATFSTFTAVGTISVTVPSTYTANFDATFTHTASGKTCKQTLDMAARDATISVGAPTLNYTANSTTADTTISVSINNGGALGVPTVAVTTDNNTQGATNNDLTVTVVGGNLSVTGTGTLEAGDVYTITIPGTDEAGDAVTEATVVVTLN